MNAIISIKVNINTLQRVSCMTGRGLNSPSLSCLNVKCNFYFFCFLNSHPSKRKVLKGAVTMTIIEELSAGSTPFPSLVPAENQAGEIT